jgi:hypothetical protein
MSAADRTLAELPAPATGDSAACTAPEVAGLLETIENKRSFDRNDFVATVQIFELDDSGAVISAGVDTKAFDISRGGMGLHSRRMYYPRTPVVLCVRIPGAKPRVLGGMVMYTRYRDRGVYHIGIEFGKLPTSQIFQNWLRCLQHQFDREH